MVDYVSLDDYTGESSGSKQIVADSMKFSADVVYLPEVRNTGGWSSSIVIRNDSTSSAQVGINYYNTSGGWVSDQTTTIAGNGSKTRTPPSGFSGSAVVVASQDVSVVVVNDSGSDAYAYIGIPSAPSVSGIGAGTEIFVPSYFRNFYGWSSTLYVQNTGGAATTVHAYFYDSSGNQILDWPSTVYAGGRVTFFLTGGSAINLVRVTASQPLAAAVSHYHANMSTAYACPSSGGSTGYVTSLMKNFYGWDSSYVAQETTGNSVTAPVSYYPPDGSGPTLNLNGRGQQTVWMGGESQLPYTWIGSARASVTGGSGQMALAVHQASATGAQAYHGSKAGARDLSIPFLRQGVGGWNSSLTVQNVWTSNAQVSVHFYSSSGSEVGSYGPFTLGAGYSRVLYGELPVGTSSAWVHSAGADVVAVVQQSHTNGRAVGYAVP